jgi:hypothetical protein
MVRPSLTIAIRVVFEGKDHCRETELESTELTSSGPSGSGDGLGSGVGLGSGDGLGSGVGLGVGDGVGSGFGFFLYLSASRGAVLEPASRLAKSTVFLLLVLSARLTRSPESTRPERSNATHLPALNDPVADAGVAEMRGALFILMPPSDQLVFATVWRKTRREERDFAHTQRTASSMGSW